MKKKLQFVSIIFLSLLSVVVFAGNTQYKIYVDAGSSGSRLHLYKCTESLPTSLPAVEDVFSESSKPGISSFANNPEAVGDSFKKILDDAVQYLQQQKISSPIPVSIFATAGMRLLPDDKQQAIYDNLNKYIFQQYGANFYVSDAKTITGQMEGYYAWLGVNYMLGNLQTGNPTVGIIDMGGASTQISFATTDESKPDDELNVEINHKKYTIFSESFLGLGQDQARNSMMDDQTAGYCFPKGYAYKQNNNGDFNFVGCETIYDNIITKKEVAQKTISSHQPFIAFSGTYYTYNFFNADKTPNQSNLETHLQNVCSETWQQLQSDYPTVAEKYLSTYCANGVYIDQLIYNTYKINDSQLTVTNQINQKDIDWPLGAVLDGFVVRKSSKA